jgi:hypothetical protein
MEWHYWVSTLTRSIPFPADSRRSVAPIATFKGAANANAASYAVAGLAAAAALVMA